MHPNGKSLANDIFLWHLTPDAAVAAVVAVVAHHKVMARGDRHADLSGTGAHQIGSQLMAHTAKILPRPTGNVDFTGGNRASNCWEAGSPLIISRLPT